jgi:lysyl-tRNA synthetase, class II
MGRIARPAGVTAERAYNRCRFVPTRRRKVDRARLHSRSVPGAKRFPDRDDIASLRAEAETLDAGQESDTARRAAGRVVARRDLGKVVFLDLVDRSGRIQLVCQHERVGEMEVDLGDVIGITGRPTRTRRGEPSLAVDELEILSKMRRSFPDTFHGLTDVETRYRQRYLDLLTNEDARRLPVARARIVSAVRAYLDGEGFLEVETPILQPRYGGGFAEPFVTHSNELDTDLYLRIADELYLKRLIVGGLEKVYELSKDFRNESTSYKHSPEFTQVEWYEAYADYRDTMERTEALVLAAADAVGSARVTFRGHAIDLSAPWQRVRFVEALEEKGVWSRDEADLRAKLTKAGVDTGRDRSWSQLVDHAYSHFVEPELIQPTFVYDWPLELSPFARTTDEDETLVERFEAVVGGMEFANAFSELNDAEEQAERFALQEAEREAGAEESEPGDPDFVEALSFAMPPTGGCGIGIDRLTMVLTGRDTIRDVILFPALRSRGA